MNSTTNSHHNVPKTQLHVRDICNGGCQCIEQVEISLKKEEKKKIIQTL